jgi:predicted aspartyl protease
VNRQSDRIRCIRHLGGVLVAATRLNRKIRARLLVDTEAAITIVVPRTANRLGLSLHKPHRMLAIGTAHTTRAPLIPTFKLDYLQIGGIEITNLEIGVVDFPPRLRIDGALGVNFLAQFRTTFEFDTATLILRPPPY